MMPALAYSKQHGEGSMLDARRKGCSNDTGTRTPFFTIEGSKAGTYCKQHVESGMLNLCDNRF